MRKFAILQISSGEKREIEDLVVEEFPLSVILNQKEISTLYCTPVALEYLVLGFLYTQGFIKGKEEVKKLEIDLEKGRAHVEAILNAREELREIKSDFTISSEEIFELMRQFQKRSCIFQATGGTHSAALCDKKGIIIFHEDLGRHNAIDKVLGEALLRDIPTEDKIILASGRIPSEILLKVARAKIPICASISAPTALAIELADKFGITIAGFVRGERMNIYSHKERIT